jgi:hypothetical protein
MQELFDYPSIAMNQQGKKSERQAREIQSATSPSIWLWGGVIILGLGGCFYLVLSTLGGGGGGLVGLFVSILGIVGLVAALRGLVIWNLRRQLLSEPVQSAEGTVQFETHNVLAKLVMPDGYRAETFDGQQLHPVGLAGVNPKLPPGDYRFYFLKTRGWLLASEPLYSFDELRATVNDLLASAGGYELAHLEKCRLEASLGQLKTVEGLPKLELLGGGEDELTEYFCTLGEVKFQISGALSNFIYEALSYRAYLLSGGQLAALEVA